MAPNADERADKTEEALEEGVMVIDEQGNIKKPEHREPLLLHDPKGEY